MANPWVSPASGNLLNNGQPWHHNDTVNITLQFTQDANPTSLVLSGGELPPGLFLNLYKIQGTIGPLPKDKTSYPVVFRATYATETGTRTYDRSFIFQVDPKDEEQSWSTDTQFNLGSVNRGSNVNIDLHISDPDDDPLVYQVMGVNAGAGTFSGLPYGLTVDTYGRITGSPTVTDNQPGDYYFRIYARDPDDTLRVPQGEGDPRMSRQTFKLTVAPEIILDARLSDVVRWNTPEGSLGSTYETYPSHFAVSASPEYQVSGISSTETQQISYTLTAQSKPLPTGLMLDQLTGLIIGRCPYVTVNTTYEFTVEARVVFVNISTGAVRQSTIASQRTFSISIRSIFGVDSVTKLEINVPAPARTKIAEWIWGNKVEVRDDYVENTTTYQGDGTTVQFLAPSGKKQDEIKVFIDGQLNTRPYDVITSNKSDYVVFQTGETETLTDLSGWVAEGNGNWALQPGNATVKQNINGTPTVFYSDYLAYGKKLSGTIEVLPGSGDDDFIGFVVGFQPGDITATQTDFILIDWKKADQTGLGVMGFSVSKVTGGFGPNAGDHSKTGITELARGNTLGDVGWVEGQSYSFDIEFSLTNIKVWVDDVLQVDVNGTFADGRFGFYNNSQGGVQYAGVASSYLAPPDGVNIVIKRYTNQSDGTETDYLTILGHDNVYRASDDNFGKRKDYRILLASGLNYTQDGSFMDKLKDYHHPTKLRIGQLAWAAARSPEGVYLYDMIYLTIQDPMEGAAGFDVQNKEQLLNRYQGSLTNKKTAIPQWNLSADDSHYFPNSIRNLRLDMEQQSNRLAWPEQNQPAATRGYGLVGKEGLPLWMVSEQTSGQPSSVLNYVCAIELVCVRPGSGAGIVKTLTQAGMNDDLQGTTIDVDRYLLNSDGFSSTTFDFDPDTGSITTFDGPDNLTTPTTQLTTFDTVLQSEAKYYKFPPGDKTYWSDSETVAPFLDPTSTTNPTRRWKKV